jgi:hypothetical protein
MYLRAGIEHSPHPLRQKHICAQQLREAADSRKTFYIGQAGLLVIDLGVICVFGLITCNSRRREGVLPCKLFMCSERVLALKELVRYKFIEVRSTAVKGKKEVAVGTEEEHNSGTHDRRTSWPFLARR